MQITIRQERKADYDAIYTVIQTAFDAAEFSDHDEQNLVNRLRESAAFIPELSLVAEVENEVVGHILFTEITVGDTTLLALAPVAVLPQFQGESIGSALIEKGHAIAREMGYIGSVVLGHSGYYPRFGYRNASEFGILAPFEVADDHFMAIEFQKDALSTVSGIVAYAKEFFE